MNTFRDVSIDFTLEFLSMNSTSSYEYIMSENKFLYSEQEVSDIIKIFCIVQTIPIYYYA